MSHGPLQGRLRSFHLGAVRCNLLETNQSLFLSGTRRPKPCTVAIPLEEPKASSPYRAQGIPVEWPALMGYNRHITDFDLKLPAGARLATIVIGKEVCWSSWTAEEEASAPWNAGKAPINWNYCRSCNNACGSAQPADSARTGMESRRPDQLIDSVIRCFEAPMARTRPIAKREARHEAAIDLLHWCSRNPMTPVSVEELSAELFQSRTSLFKGSKEHFEQTPLGCNAPCAWIASGNCCRTQPVVPAKASAGLATAQQAWASPAATSLAAIRSTTENSRRTHCSAWKAQPEPGARNAYEQARPLGKNFRVSKNRMRIL